MLNKGLPVCGDSPMAGGLDGEVPFCEARKLVSIRETTQGKDVEKSATRSVAVKKERERRGEERRGKERKGKERKRLLTGRALDNAEEAVFSPRSTPAVADDPVGGHGAVHDALRPSNDAHDVVDEGDELVLVKDASSVVFELRGRVDSAGDGATSVNLCHHVVGALFDAIAVSKKEGKGEREREREGKQTRTGP